MKKVIWKAYWDYEKEEAWLNEMASKGLALNAYSWCRYVFEDCKPGEYTYRIELLENTHTHPESKKYLDFLEETGVEHVASYMRWAYFRKKSDSKGFELYTDIDSRIKHYKGVRNFFFTFMVLELIIGLGNISTGLTIGSQYNFYGGVLCTLFGVFFTSIVIKMIKKIRKLKNLKTINE